MSRLFRPTLELVKAYVPTPPQPGYRLHLNESPEDVPTEVKAAAAERLLSLDWSRYPEETDALIGDLAARDGWTRDGVMLGNGSNELLQLIVWTTLSPGDAVVLASPSFSHYATQAKAAGATLIEVPLRDRVDTPFRFDVERLGRAARDSAARLVLIASPNNPTGTLLTHEQIEWLHDQTTGILAVDEAYRDFADQDLAPLLERCERLVLLRTFSKAYAAAALRVGYLLASPAICTELTKLQMTYSLGAISASLARELLRRSELMRERVAHVRSERERMREAFSRVPSLRVEDGCANFVVVEHASKPAKAIAGEMARRGVLVRELSGYAGCERCVRISIGTREANEAAIAALVEVS